jgi:hypothetical protein
VVKRENGDGEVHSGGQLSLSEIKFEHTGGAENSQSLLRPLNDSLKRHANEALIGYERRAVAARFGEAYALRDELPVFDPVGTTVERLETGRSRWWTFAGVKANWLLGHAVHDFYIEMKGTISIAAIRELLASIVNRRALDRESAERVSTQPVWIASRCSHTMQPSHVV